MRKIVGVIGFLLLLGWELPPAFGAPPDSVRWSDPETGREYLVFERSRSWVASHHLCQSHDMGVLTPEELTQKELENLAAAHSLYKGLTWEESRAKTRARMGGWTSRYVKGFVKKKSKWEAPQVRTAARLWVLRKTLEPEASLPPYFETKPATHSNHTICMSYEDHWFGCQVEFVCSDPAPQAKYEKYIFWEFGGRKQGVIDQIVRRSQSPAYLGLGCDLRMDTMECKRYSF